MTLEQHIVDIQAGIRVGRFVNEASVSQGIVLRLLGALSWPTYDTQIICPEFSLGGRRVDFALCHPPGKPIAFVEVKQVGQSDGVERQLFEYAFHSGVPLAILTDGPEWSFFLPGEQGDYGERRVYKLDIIEREESESASRFTRYLQYDRIVSGAALNAAREDYRNVSRERQMKATLPDAWQKLVEEEDALLLEVIADKVESLCGFKPDPNSVAKFLQENVALKASERPTPRPVPPRPLPPRGDPVVAPGPLSPTRDPSRQVPSGEPDSRTVPVGFTLQGQRFPARNAREVLKEVFEALSARDGEFLERFAALPQHGRRRRYLAQNKEDLYPGRPDLARDYSVKLTSGWWIGTDYDSAEITKIIERACNVANLRFGQDLQIMLSKRSVT